MQLLQPASGWVCRLCIPFAPEHNLFPLGVYSSLLAPWLLSPWGFIYVLLLLGSTFSFLLWCFSCFILFSLYYALSIVKSLFTLSIYCKISLYYALSGVKYLVSGLIFSSFFFPLYFVIMVVEFSHSSVVYIIVWWFSLSWVYYLHYLHYNPGALYLVSFTSGPCGLVGVLAPVPYLVLGPFFLSCFGGFYFGIYLSASCFGSPSVGST